MLSKEELVREIKKWKQKYKMIILMIEANEYNNNGKLSIYLT